MRWVREEHVSSAKGLTILYVSSPSECSWKRRLFVASPSQQRPITLKPILSRRETASQKGSTISLPDTESQGNCAYGYWSLLNKPRIMMVNIVVANVPTVPSSLLSEFENACK
jgi:hypothetical protein